MHFICFVMQVLLCSFEEQERETLIFFQLSIFVLWILNKTRHEWRFSVVSNQYLRLIRCACLSAQRRQLIKEHCGVVALFTSLKEYEIYYECEKMWIIYELVLQEREGRKDMEPRSEDGQFEEVTVQQLPQVTHTHSPHFFHFHNHKLMSLTPVINTAATFVSRIKQSRLPSVFHLNSWTTSLQCLKKSSTKLWRNARKVQVFEKN